MVRPMLESKAALDQTIFQLQLNKEGNVNVIGRHFGRDWLKMTERQLYYRPQNYDEIHLSLNIDYKFIKW